MAYERKTGDQKHPQAVDGILGAALLPVAAGVLGECVGKVGAVVGDVERGLVERGQGLGGVVGEERVDGTGALVDGHAGCRNECHGLVQGVVGLGQEVDERGAAGLG